MEPEDMVRVALFNYMIGNTDYSVPGRHNVKIMMPNDLTKELGVPIPYDFDYAGIVDASYAVPAEGLKILSIKDRYYMGSCANKEVIPKILEEFMAKKEELFELISSFEYLSEKENWEMRDYLLEFFEMAESENFIEINLLSSCE